MKYKINLIVLLLLIISGCKEAPPTKVESCVLEGEQIEEESEIRACNEPEPSEYANLEVNVLLREFSNDQEDKMRKALERMKLVVNSKEFKAAVLAHTYNDEKTFVDNNGLTNEEIYEKILKGIETFNNDEDYEMDLDITLYYKNNGVVGYTYPDTNRIWVNNKFFANYTLGQVAANAFHEWTHKIGFNHDYNRTARRAYSVPYALGNIVKKMVDSM